MSVTNVKAYIDNREGTTDHIFERSDRLTHSNHEKESRSRRKEFTAVFRKDSDNLEKRLSYDLRTLSEVEKTTESMRQYLANGDTYEDSHALSIVSVSECLKIKREAKDRQRNF